MGRWWACKVRYEAPVGRSEEPEHPENGPGAENTPETPPETTRKTQTILVQIIPRPDGIIGTIRDSEMLAYNALRNDSLSTLIEDSATNPVAYRAVQEVLRRLRATSEEIPSELQEWSYDVAVGDQGLPTTGPGRSPFTNQVRDAAIIETMEILTSCGLKATRNEASNPNSAADAVSVALRAHEVELQTESVSKIWGAEPERS